MENTMPAQPRYYGSELISIKLKRRDVIFIGQTISKYPVDGIAEFLKIINKTVKESDVIDEDFLNEIVEIKITVNLLFDIHNKLGAEQEFFYADFNATIAVQLTAMISELFSTDVDLATYLLEYFTAKKNEIENSKNLQINQYISKWFY